LGKRSLKQQHLQQQQQQQDKREPTGELVLQRWLLRAAGVHVVEVEAAEWEGVKQHEAAAEMFVAQALEEQL
jgi:hypothetical protein